MARRLKLDELKYNTIEHAPMQTIDSVEYLLRKKGLQKLANTNRSQEHTRRESPVVTAGADVDKLLLTGQG